MKQGNPGDRLHKLAEVMLFENPAEMYHLLVSHWKNSTEIVLNAQEPPTIFTDKNKQAKLSKLEHIMMYTDLVSYLPDDILTKVDRASMSVSLEARVPILDHRVVEFAWSLPFSMKIRDNQSKWLLRQVLYKYVPEKLIERPKKGFAVPISEWLRKPLREWAENLLDEKKLKDDGFFKSEPIRQKWTEHLSGQRNWHYYLWDILMFQAWLERWA